MNEYMREHLAGAPASLLPAIKATPGSGDITGVGTETQSLGTAQRRNDHLGAALKTAGLKMGQPFSN